MSSSHHQLTYADRLSAELKRQNLSQPELARRLGVNQNTVGQWFRRGGEPNARTLLRVARVLAVDPWWLLTGEGERSTVEREPTDIDSDVAELRRLAVRSDDARRMIHYLATVFRKTP